ncbi:MAG: tetratricopeptide repeat protein [Actinomycetota bacterium]
MRAKLVAGGLAVGVLFYLVLLGQRAWILVTSGEAGAAGLGAGLLVLPLLVAWAVWRELRFGMATERMARVLQAEGGMPAEELPRTPGGRVDRTAADAVFGRYREAVETSPEDWRAWFRLAWAYDTAGDRRRAREAMRHAVSLFG